MCRDKPFQASAAFGKYESVAFSALTLLSATGNGIPFVKKPAVVILNVFRMKSVRLAPGECSKGEVCSNNYGRPM